MWKIIGSIIGFFVFGPIGSLIGFTIGIFLDKNFGFIVFDDFVSEESILESFVLLLTDLTKVEGINKNTILNIKNIVIKNFGINKAKIIMQLYKKYSMIGYGQDELERSFNFLLYNCDYIVREQIIFTLFKIINSKGYITKREIERLNYFCLRLNIINNFFYYNTNNTNYNFNESYDFNNNKNYFYNDISNYYKILDISEKATEEEIKKRYRELCKKYHPDKVNNMSEKVKKEYEEKLKSIIEAYNKIKEERGFK